MKIEIEKLFLSKGNYTDEIIYTKILEEIRTAISKAVWPIGSSSFTINPQKNGNGVKKIKDGFIKHLKRKSWKTEERFALVDGLKAGPLDGYIDTEIGAFAIEWETGNISSSHRALNKLALAIINKQIVGGFIVLPTSELYKYLTDRVGNYDELAPYFPLYQNLNIEKGILGVFGVTFDNLSKDVELIPKGSDGMSKKD